MSGRTVVGAVVACALAAGAFVAFRHLGDGPPPPEPSAAIADPSVADAVERALRRVRAGPRDAVARADLAMCYDAHGFLAEAATVYAQALDLEPDETRWRWFLARTLERLDRFPEAREAAERVVAEAPDYAAARWTLAMWLVARGDLDGALVHARGATAAAPADATSWTALAAVLLERGDAGGGENAARRALRLEFSDPAVRRHAHFVLGRCLTELGRAEEAKVELARRGDGAQMRWPDPWVRDIGERQTGFDALVHGAHEAVLAENDAGALPVLLELRRRRPDHVQVLTDLGVVYRRLGRLDEAVEALQTAGRAHRSAAEPRVQLALAFESMGRAALARAAIDEAIALRPELGEPYEVRGMMSHRAGDVDAALRDFATAFEKDPTRTWVFVHAGVAELERGRAEAALAAFERAAAGDVTDAEAQAGIALARHRLGNAAGARAALSRSRALAPEGGILQDVAREEIGE